MQKLSHRKLYHIQLLSEISWTPHKQCQYWPCHGWKAMAQTENGVLIPTIFKSGIPYIYIEHYYPTDAQIRYIRLKEVMTPLGEWNPTLLDNSMNVPEQHLNRLPPNVTDNFYNIQGDNIV